MAFSPLCSAPVSGSSRFVGNAVAQKSRRVRSLIDPGAIALICLATLLLTIPLLVYGPYPKGHDVYEHTYFGTYFSAQLWKGDLHPVWLRDINSGLGSPSFFVFPPFGAYVFALFQPLVAPTGLGVLAVTEIVALLLSGVCAFVWFRDQYSRPVAITASILYLLLPYHLEIDSYLRGAMGECWAMVWIPLLLFCTNRIMRGRGLAVVGFGVVYAVLILSHLISVLMISAIPLAMALFLGQRDERRRVFLRLGAGMVLGVCLSAFYFLPALRSSEYFPPSHLMPDLHEFLISPESLFGSSDPDPFKHRAALCGAEETLGCLSIGIGLLIRGSQRSKRVAWFWLAVCVPPCLGLWSFSAPFWRIAYPLLELIQYQFRLNLILCLAEIALLAALLADLDWGTGRAAVLRIALVTVIVAPWLFSYGAVWKAYLREGNPKAEFDNHQYSYHSDGWFWSWYKGSAPKRTFLSSQGPRARFIDGTGTVRVNLWEPRHIEIETDSAAGGTVLINQFYYPLWRARSMPSMNQILSPPSRPEGLLTAEVPAGHAQIQFDIPVHKSEVFGKWISLLSLLATGFLAWHLRRTS